MVAKRMRVQNIKKLSHSLQAVSEVVLGVLRIRNLGALPPCAVNCIHAHFPEPNRLEINKTFKGIQYADK